MDSKTAKAAKVASDDLCARTADCLGLCDVHRWNVIRTTRNQSVGEHSFAVAIIAWELAIRLGIIDAVSQAQVMYWSLIHDVPETLTGDIDGKFKRDYPAARAAICEAENRAFPWYQGVGTSIPEFVRWIVKVADRIETWAYIRQWGMGVRADDVRRELEALIRDIDTPGLQLVMQRHSTDIDPDDVVATVSAAIRAVMNHSVGEEYSIQLRRFKTMDGGEGQDQ